MLAVSWTETVHVGSSSISLALYFCVFALSVVDCSSSLVFWSYVFDPAFTARPPTLPEADGAAAPHSASAPSSSEDSSVVTALATGENLSGVVMSVFALIQSARWGSLSDDANRFSVAVYFALIAVVMGVSGLAFAGLERERYARALWLRAADSSLTRAAGDAAADGSSAGIKQPLLPIAASAASNPASAAASSSTSTSSSTSSSSAEELTAREPVPLWHTLRAAFRSHATSLWLLMLVNFLSNGVAPSLVPRALCAYDDGNALVYWQAVIGVWMEALGSLVAGWGPVRDWLFDARSTHRTLYASLVMCVAYVALCVYLMVAAFRYPAPLYNATRGVGLIMLAVVLCARLLCTLFKTLLWMTMHQHAHAADKESAADARSVGRIGGVFTQFGALLGSVLALILSLTGALSSGSCY